METVLRIALWNVACGAALALLALAVSRSCRRPALGHLLWLLALLKLLTPPLWTVGIKSFPAAAPPGRTVDLVHSQTAARQAPEIHSVPVVAGSDSPRMRPSEHSRRWPIPLIVAIWAAGSVTCAGIAIVRVRRFLPVLRCGALDEGLQRRLYELAGRIGLGRSPSVRLVPGRVCPMVWWAFGRPRLLLPAALWAGLDDAKRDALILHELAHLKRRDHWVRIVELLATAAYWWDPLVWWVRREMRACEEQCCDAWVGWLMPHQGTRTPAPSWMRSISCRLPVRFPVPGCRRWPAARGSSATFNGGWS